MSALGQKAAVCLASFLAVAPTPPASADTTLKQSVQVDVDGKSTSVQHLWSLATDKFHLEVDGSGDMTHYIFNGRTFYVCGKLKDAELRTLIERKVSDQAALGVFKTGACQVVPTNFMVRFFLSPMTSVESVDATDGLKLTLGLQDYQVKVPAQGGASGQVAGRGCGRHQRTYTLTKTAAEGKAARQLRTSIDEVICVDPAIDWRGALWNEVAKATLRQPHSGDVLRALKKEQKELPGFILSSDTRQISTDGSGKEHKQHVVIKTMSVSDADVSARVFGLPEGFKLVSDESLTRSAKSGAGETAAAGGGNETANTLDIVRSTLFCALASFTGVLGCLGTAP